MSNILFESSTDDYRLLLVYRSDNLSFWCFLKWLDIWLISDKHVVTHYKIITKRHCMSFLRPSSDYLRSDNIFLCLLTYLQTNKMSFWGPLWTNYEVTSCFLRSPYKLTKCLSEVLYKLITKWYHVFKASLQTNNMSFWGPLHITYEMTACLFEALDALNTVVVVWCTVSSTSDAKLSYI